jgi:iron complex transport system ATP-binding protein
MYIETNNLTVGYPLRNGQKEVLKSLNLSLKEGLTALIGLNGSGKSTLMKSLANLLPPLDGSLFVGGEIVKKNTDLSSKVSLVTTEKVTDVRFSVREIVEIGRYPHTTWTMRLSKKDREIIENALEATGCTEIAEKKISELSDGQYQKTMIARALAQETPICLLDEATSHLDVLNRYDIAFMLKNVARTEKKAILISTHNLETGFEAADEVWLIDENKNIVCGSPEDLVLGGAFSRLFDGKNVIFDVEKGGICRQNETVIRAHFNLQGDPVAIFWLEKALLKKGFGRAADAENFIEAEQSKGSYVFRLNGEKVFHSVAELLESL